MIWLTSDTHFNHANIIKYCSRPFADAETMNRELIARWNASVQPGDYVFHLGDFALGKADEMLPIFEQLNGFKHLIRGNHDSRKTMELPWSGTYQHYFMPQQNQKIFLVHDPKVAKASVAPCLVLHGHLHGTAELHPFPKHPHVKYIDVGVDCFDYKPVSIQQLTAEG